MPNFLSFIQQPYFILLFLAAVGATLLAVFLMMSYFRKDPYSIGKRKGGKLARLLLPHRLTKNSEGKYDYEKLKKQVEKATEEIFQTGFTRERSAAQQMVEAYEKEIKKLQEELQEENTSVNQQREGRKSSYEKEQAVLLERIKQVEGELQQNLSKEVAALQDSNMKQKAPRYTLLTTASRLGNVLSGSLKTLENDLLWFGMVGVFLLLLAGDFYIFLDIFGDLMPNLRLTGSIFLYIGSGIIALVFVVLFEFFFEYLEKKSVAYREKMEIIQIWSIVIVGFLLFLVYLLIISASIFPDKLGGRILDAILRTLFLPLVIAAALIFQKIRKQYGFRFLLNPFKFLLGAIIYLIVVLLLPVEFLVRVFQGQSKNLRSKTPFEQMKERELATLRSQSSESIRGLEQNESQIRKAQSYLENKVQQKIQVFQNAKQKYEAYLAALYQGCGDAIYDEMYKKLGR